MRLANPSKHCLGKVLGPVWLLIIATAFAHGSVKLQLCDGRPVVDGVYVNGHGPFRFLLDTGSNLNLIGARVARKIGLATTGQVELASAAGTTSVTESDGNEIALDAAKASGQRFLISSLDAIHNSSPDVQGVLGSWFLAQFDFALDFQMHTLTFGGPPAAGDPASVRIGFQRVNLRPVISTSLGNLVLDSGLNRVVLFGVRPDDAESGYELRTLAGNQFVGKSFGKQLVIAGQRIWKGDAVAIPTPAEAGVDGLLPLNLFKMLYICNSTNYILFR